MSASAEVATPNATRAVHGWWAFALYLAAGVLVTWPLAAHLGTHLALGTLNGPTVPWFNLWSLEWNADRLAHGLSGYWDAPIFFPAHDTFALSEPQAGSGLLFAMLRVLVNPVAAYNGVLLLALALDGLAARYLLRVCGVGAPAATLAGLFAVASAFAMKELGVVQLLALYGPLFAVAELRRLLRAEGGMVWIRLAWWCAVTLWTCVYYALLLAPFLALGLLLCAYRRALRLRPYVYVTLALAIGLSAATPLVLVQRRALAAHTRPAETIRGGSASLVAYLRLPPNTLGARVNPLLRADKPSSRALFPGSALLLLAGLGFWRTRRGPERTWMLFCAGSCLLAVVLSCGTRWGLAGVHPYEWLVQRVIPGFAQLRSPYRFAAFVHVFMIPLAGFGLEEVLRWARPRKLAPWVPVVFAALLLEGVPLPQPLHRFPFEQLRAPWVEWLRRQPAGAVAMVPPEQGGRARDYEPVALAMLQSLVHRHPLIGGYSGFFPSAAHVMSDKLRSFPETATLSALQRANVRYVVVDNAWLQRAGPRTPNDKAPPGAWSLVHASAGKLIYRISVPHS